MVNALRLKSFFFDEIFCPDCFQLFLMNINMSLSSIPSILLNLFLNKIEVMFSSKL